MIQNLKKKQFVVKKCQEFGKCLSKHSKVSVICTLIGPFCAKDITLDLKSTEELSFMTMKCYAKFQEELTHGFKSDMRSLVNFHQGTQKSQNFHLHGLLLSKVYNVWVKKVQRSYLSWHQRVMQNFKRKWPVSSKLTWGI